MERVYTTPLLDKLWVRPGMRVALIDIDDADIRSLLEERTTDLTEGWPELDTDVVLLGAARAAGLVDNKVASFSTTHTRRCAWSSRSRVDRAPKGARRRRA